MALTPHWHSEDRGFWRRHGCSGAARRRCVSVSLPMLTSTLAFAVWMLWSVVVLHLPAAGFHFSINQRFWLTALPALSGATLRLFCAFAAPVLAGRRVTAVITASLLVPTLGMALALQDPGTAYEWMVALALLCGLGGALGSHAGRGHLGVAAVQLVVPVVIAVAALSVFGGPAQATAQGPMWLQNAGLVGLPLIALVALLVWFCMDDSGAAGAGFSQQAVIFTRKHNWLMCWLVLGSFGSFIGLAAGVPLLIQHQFPQANLLLAGLGPLLGALLRPVGGWLADQYGAARVSGWSFVVMALGAAAVLPCLPHAGQGGSLTGALAAFGVLFAASGLANGSTLRMIPRIFLGQRQHAAEPLPTAQAQAIRQGRIEAAAVLGLASAIGAYGGFFIPKGLGFAIAMTGSPAAALQAFIVFYVSCVALTWWCCGRRRASTSC